MTESPSIEISCVLGSTSKYHINSSERKINLLEHRLTGPNKAGSAPIPSTPNTSQENDVENIKIKLFQIDNQLQSHSTKSNSRNSNNSVQLSLSKKNVNLNKSKDGDLLNFLLQKRNHDQDISSTNTSTASPKEGGNNRTNHKINSITSNKNNSNNIKHHKKIPNSKRLNPANNNCKLKDYYKSSTPPSSNTSNCDLPLSDSINQNINLQHTIDIKNQIILEKDNEITTLTKTINNLQNQLNAVNNYYKTTSDDLEKSRNCLIKFVKENAELKRQILKKEINEKQFTIGHISSQRLSNGQVLEYFEEGNDFKILSHKFYEIQHKRNEITKQQQNDSLLSQYNNALMTYKLNELNREETELKIQKEHLLKQKAQMIRDINLLREEEKCTYIGKWNLLGQRYQLISLLGKGGYSEVYKAFDLQNQKYVACKIHQLNVNWREEVKDSYIKHTMRENQIMKEIHHRNIVQHYDTIEINNNSFCSVLELCEGTDLGSYLKQRKRLPEKEVKVITHQILDALLYLNNLNKKIIHYDIKPQNIMFSDLEVKLTDFGLAKIIEQEQNEISLTSQGVGTYYYLPPECFERGSDVKISPKVDIWSLGIVVYEMLFGIKPFGNNYSQEKFVREKMFNNSKEVIFDDNIVVISKECKEFIKNCLRQDEEKRYDVYQAINSEFISK